MTDKGRTSHEGVGGGKQGGGFARGLKKGMNFFKASKHKKGMTLQPD